MKLKNKNEEKRMSRDGNSCLLQSDGRSRFTDLAEINYQTKNKPTNSNDSSLLGEKSWGLELLKYVIQMSHFQQILYDIHRNKKM